MMPEFHTVRQGECMADIAARYGFQDYHTIWDHPKNSGLKRKRQNPNVLSEADSVYIPSKQEKEDPRGTDQRHAHNVPNPKVLYRTIIRDAKDEPLTNAAYTMKLGSQTITGCTNGEGLLEQEIPLKFDTAELRLDDLGVTWTVHFGQLDPIESISGLKQRLKSLGYPPGSVTAVQDDGLRAALRAFQKDNDLSGDGDITAETLSKVKEKYGC